MPLYNSTPPKYKDLGVVVTTSGISATAIISSGWYTNTAWVKQIIFKARSDKKFDLYVYRKSEAGIEDWGSAVITDVAATNPSWACVLSNFSTNHGLGGNALKFAIKNSSTESNTVAEVAVELVG